MSILPNLIYRLNEIKLKISANYFCDRRQTDSEVYTKKQKIRNSQHDIEVEEQGWRINTTQLPDLLQSCCNKSIVVLVKEETD